MVVCQLIDDSYSFRWVNYPLPNSATEMDYCVNYHCHSCKSAKKNKRKVLECHLRNKEKNTHFKFDVENKWMGR